MDAIGDMTVFAAVVKAGSFVGAARRLGMTASGVSRRIGRFEDRLGVRLLNRTTRRISLTEAGEALYERCDEILASIEEAEEAALHLRRAPRGVLRVAASDAFALKVLIPFLTGFQARYPELRVVLVQGDGPIDLLASRIDVAIRFELPTSTSFVARKLIDDPWIFCASPAYLEAHGRPRTPDDLAGHRCLTIHARDVTSDRWRFDDPADGKPVNLDIASVFSGIGLAVREAALAGLGIGRIAHFLVSCDLAAGDLVPLLTDWMPDEGRAIYLVYPDRRYLPSKARVFIDELAGHVAAALPQPQISKAAVPLSAGSDASP